MKYLPSIARIVLLSAAMFGFIATQAQQVNGCVGGRFGVDGGLYSGVVEYGLGNEPSFAPFSNDWFIGPKGLGVIDQSNPGTIQSLLQAPGNPIYVRRMSSPPVSILAGQTMIDAMFARDHFGGTGGIDQTSFNTASKNGEDPAIWDPGPQNVLGKSDIIDHSGHMFRDGIGQTSNLLFVGLVNFAEPGGSAYFDFEFFVEDVSYNPGTGFSSGGPQLGHTAFEFNPDGTVKKVGDIIFAISITSGGAAVEPRLWVSRADWLAFPSPLKFDWTGSFDGAYTGSPYGYAGIKPITNNLTELCYYVTGGGQTPLAPPWGTKNSKSNAWSTNYQAVSVIEIGFNLTAFGIDHASLSGTNPCYFPLNTYMIKSRASDSFTAQLKDFGGPYSWGRTRPTTVVIDHTNLSCLNTTATLLAVPDRPDVTYNWTTIDGRILTAVNQRGITVDRPGIYSVSMTLPNGCPSESLSDTIGYDSNYPFFDPLIWTKTVACNGSNGSIDLSVSGATPTYTYVWSNGAITQDLSGLAVGTYSVTVTDGLGCWITSGAISIDANIPVNISSTTTPTTCYGSENGAIDVTATGGRPPLSYYWSTGGTPEDLQNIPAGTYTLTVTDADGCTTSSTIAVTQPAAISVTLDSKADDTNADPVAGDGTIYISPAGGTPAYTYVWSALLGGSVSGQVNNQDLSNLDYGLYTVVVTDANTCTGTLSVMIYEPEVCNDGIDNNGNGLTDCQDLTPCQPATPASITPSDNTPCIGSGYNITYTTPVNAAYDSYQWTYPGTATYVSGQGSNVLTLYWTSTTGGVVCVRGQKFACLSTPRCITVNPIDVPPQPGDINVNNH